MSMSHSSSGRGSGGAIALREQRQSRRQWVSQGLLVAGPAAIAGLTHSATVRLVDDLARRSLV
jgi:hypothetical protein